MTLIFILGHAVGGSDNTATVISESFRILYEACCILLPSSPFLYMKHGPTDKHKNQYKVK